MNTYDAFIPMGETCIATHNLRQKKLQYESLPFDWIWIRDIKMAECFLRTHFADFMHKDALIYKGPETHNTDRYADTLSGTEFWHDFPSNVPLDKCYDEVCGKYRRRIERLYDQIEHARRILFFRVIKIKPDTEPEPGVTRMFSHEIAAEDKIIREFAELQKLYPHKKIDLLLLYVWNIPHNFEERRLNDNIRVFELYCPDSLGWTGDVALIGSKVLGDYRLSLKQNLIYKFKSVAFKVKKLVTKIGAALGFSYCKNMRKKQKDIMKRD